MKSEVSDMKKPVRNLRIFPKNQEIFYLIEPVRKLRFLFRCKTLHLKLKPGANIRLANAVINTEDDGATMHLCGLTITISEARAAAILVQGHIRRTCLNG